MVESKKPKPILYTQPNGNCKNMVEISTTSLLLKVKGTAETLRTSSVKPREHPEKE